MSTTLPCPACNGNGSGTKDGVGEETASIMLQGRAIDEYMARGGKWD